MNAARSLGGASVLVIGGSSGIGLAVARAARDAGGRVTIAGRSKERLEAARSELGDEVLARPVDVRDPDSVTALLEGTGTLHHVALLAGGNAGGLVVDTDVATFRAEMDTRFWGAMHVCRSAAPRLPEGGSITLCSGAVAHRPAPTRSAMSAMALGVEGLGRALALELAPLRVNTVVPGPIDTPRLRQALGPDDPSPEEFAKRLEQAFGRLPVRRVGKPDEIADAFLFLMTNGFMTGQSLIIDGGYLLS